MHPFDPNEVLALPLMANVATVAADGAPRNSPMWFIWEDDVLWMPTGISASVVKRLGLDPRCSVEIVHFDNERGVLLHVGLRGEASVEPDCQQRFRRLLKKYLGSEENWNDWFIQNIAKIDAPSSRMMRLKPDTIFTNNASFFKTGPDMAWPTE